MGKITTTLYGDVTFFPYEASAPAREVLEWKTAVLDSYNGSEVRYQERTKPRQEFEFSFPLSIVQKIDALNILYGGIRDLVAIPLWTEKQYIGSVTGGATSVSCDITNYSLRSNSLAVLYASWDTYQLVEIESAGGGAVTFTESVDSMVGAYIIPVRVGYIDGDVNYITDGLKAPVRFKFLVSDCAAMSPSEPTQYDSTDIYYDETIASGGMLSKTISKRQMIDDFTLGSFSAYTPWTNTRIAFSYSGIIQGAEEVTAFKLFLNRRLGMYRQFYYPTWELDFDIESTGTITTTVDVVSNNLVDYASLRDQVVFIDYDGNQYPRRVDALAQVDANTARLTISSALNIDASQIKLACFLGYFRFDTDRIEMSWIGNSVMRFSIPIIEIKPNRALPVVIE